MIDYVVDHENRYYQRQNGNLLEIRGGTDPLWQVMQDWRAVEGNELTLIDSPVVEVTLADYKRAKVVELARQIDMTLTGLEPDVPEYEVAAYPEKLKMVDDYEINQRITAFNSPLFVELIAYYQKTAPNGSVVDIPQSEISDLLQRIRYREALYRVLKGYVPGFRRRIRDQINAATDTNGVDIAADHGYSELLQIIRNPMPIAQQISALITQANQ